MRAPTLTSFALTRLLLSASVGALLLTAACSGRTTPGPSDDQHGGLTGRECDDSGACGPAPGAPAEQCADGSVGGNTGRCLEYADGTCLWENRDCPSDPGACAPEDCTGPITAQARVCDDGSSVGASCAPDPDGGCSYQFICPGDGGGTCSYNGQTYEVGEGFPSDDGCNSCSCSEGGQVACTLRACVSGCTDEDGTAYAAGDSFKSPDGCNQCTCQPDGSIVCTDRACAQLQWYSTCGDPVCNSEPTDDPTVPNCDSQAAGEACSEDGAECELLDGCNTRLRCTATDPTQGPGGCPISKAEYKNDIQYLGQEQLKAVADRLLGIELTTYRYNANVNPRSSGGDPTARHLGFIIDDVGAAACVNPDGQSVNLYGYTSMAVAALKVQSQELATLRAELAELKQLVKGGEGAALKGGQRVTPGPGPIPG